MAVKNFGFYYFICSVCLQIWFSYLFLLFLVFLFTNNSTLYYSNTAILLNYSSYLYYQHFLVSLILNYRIFVILFWQHGGLNIRFRSRRNLVLSLRFLGIRCCCCLIFNFQQYYQHLQMKTSSMSSEATYHLTTKHKATL